VIRQALWLEWFKLRKRLATWIVYLIYLALSILLFGALFYSRPHGHVRAPYMGFPDAWDTVLTVGAPLASLFGAVLIALSVCAEFEWRTSRQNIIDGLSRRNWLLGKFLLIPIICVALYGTQIAFGAAWAYFDTYPPHKLFLYPWPTYVTAALGVLLGMFWYSFTALLISVLVRSSGPAIGLILIYQLFDNIVARTLIGFHLDGIAAWFPFQVHTSLLQFKQYWPHPSPTLDYHWATGNLLLAGMTWVIAFAGAAGWVYLRRDL
jgi:ABC-type transport system involved in multi-copper enzyme maturation permease subunit